MSLDELLGRTAGQMRPVMRESPIVMVTADHGWVVLSITETRGSVVRAIESVELSPDEARQLAELLLADAERIEPKG